MNQHTVSIERKASRQHLQVRHDPAGTYTRYTITLHQMTGQKSDVRCKTLLYASGFALRLDHYAGRRSLWLDSREGSASACTDISESEMRTLADGLGLPLPSEDDAKGGAVADRLSQVSPVQAESAALNECLDALAAGDKAHAEASLQKADAAQAAYWATP